MQDGARKQYLAPEPSTPACEGWEEDKRDLVNISTLGTEMEIKAINIISA